MLYLVKSYIERRKVVLKEDQLSVYFTETNQNKHTPWFITTVGNKGSWEVESSVLVQRLAFPESPHSPFKT